MPKFLEYQGKKLLKDIGAPVPAGKVQVRLGRHSK